MIYRSGDDDDDDDSLRPIPIDEASKLCTLVHLELPPRCLGLGPPFFGQFKILSCSVGALPPQAHVQLSFGLIAGPEISSTPPLCVALFKSLNKFPAD